MNRPRFILDPGQFSGTPITLGREDTHHCRILRLKAGDEAVVCDGQGHEYFARFLSFTSTSAELELLAPTGRQAESGLHLTLFQGFARGGKLDWVIEKATELGVARVVPVVSAHSQMKPNDSKENKLIRWQELARQATRQSGRTRLPQVTAPVSFSDSLQAAPELDAGVVFYEAQSADDTWQARLSQLPRPQRVGIWVGPEGGFSEAEIALAKEKGLVAVSLGPRILRSETAGMAAVCLAQFYWGDLGGGNPIPSPAKDEC